MANFCCDVDVICTVTLYGAFYMFTAFKLNLKDLCFIYIDMLIGRRKFCIFNITAKSMKSKHC